MAHGQLPDEGPVRLGSVDLPPGRLITGGIDGERIAWATVDPVPGSGQVWTALSEMHPQTGLVPMRRRRSAGRGPLNRGDSLLPLTAVLRSWEDRFGARIIDVDFDDLRLLVERPPRTLEAAQRVAAE